MSLGVFKGLEDKGARQRDGEGSKGDEKQSPC